MKRLLSLMIFLTTVCGFQQIQNLDQRKSKYFPRLPCTIRYSQNETYNEKMIVLDTLRVLNNSFHEQSQKPEKFIFETDIQENFETIGGYESIKQELLQVKDILANSAKYAEYNIRTPKGVLFEGPPGNGKTLLAKCFAGECGFNFIAVSGSDFNEKYVGIGALRVREIFQKAQQNQPCIIFIDELDAIGGKRLYNDEGSVVERFNTLNQLLVLMDGFRSDTMQNVFILGATNRKDILDSALLRSGRFDKIVHIPNPDYETRIKIIDIHRTKKPIEDFIQSTLVAQITSGLSGADIENLLNEASLEALRHDRKVDSLEQMEQVRDKLIMGVTCSRQEISPFTKRRIAIHESGHLITGFLSGSHENPVPSHY